MSKLAITTEEIIESIVHFNDDCADVTTADLRQWCDIHNYKYQTICNRLSNYKSGRGKFNLARAEAVQLLETSLNLPGPESIPSVVTQGVKTEVTEYNSLVPQSDELFVPFGCFKDVKSVIKSGIFYPLFITGLSGNGKTHAVEQACSQLKRDVVRVNITIETDEDDLIGGFRLVNGETVWHDGPVVEALKRGAVLLLDEVDLASNKIMCLQSLLEGKGVYLKKVNQYVKPADGFNVIATANTKGRGSDSGKFIGTNVLNEAFLERFAVTFEQSYPTPTVESKILARVFASLNITHSADLVKYLTDWADIIRKTFYDGGIDDVISTRRLIAIVKAYAIWDDMSRAIELCTNRFDDDTKSVFTELYQKVSGQEPVNDVKLESEPIAL